MEHILCSVCRHDDRSAVSALCPAVRGGVSVAAEPGVSRGITRSSGAFITSGQPVNSKATVRPMPLKQLKQHSFSLTSA